MKVIKSIAMAIGITLILIADIFGIIFFNITGSFLYLLPIIGSFIGWLSALIYCPTDLGGIIYDSLWRI